MSKQLLAMLLQAPWSMRKQEECVLGSLRSLVGNSLACVANQHMYFSVMFRGSVAVQYA